MTRFPSFGALAATGVIIGLGIGLGPVAASAQTDPAAGKPRENASVVASPASAAVGQEVVIEATNWPDGPALIGVCGNSARRGSQDCNLVGTQGVEIRNGLVTFRLRIGQPPIHCPCVIRMTTTNGNLVRNVPFTVEGVPLGPEILPTGGLVSAAEVPIHARLENAGSGVFAKLLPLVAGPAERTLVMTITNDSTQALEELRVVGAVGRKRSEAEPIASASVASLAPGETTTVEVPIRIGVPAWGTYEVFGSVYGLEVPGRFSAKTENDPWGLQVVLVLVLLMIARMVRRREVAADELLEHDDLLQEDSPSIGVADEDRSPLLSYPPVHAIAS